jgi:hypothetical protein
MTGYLVGSHDHVSLIKFPRDGGIVAIVLLATTASECLSEDEIMERKASDARAAARQREALRDKTPLDREGERIVGFGRALLMHERSGRWAVSLWGKVIERFDDLVDALVKFEEVVRKITGRDLKWYVDRDEVLDKLVGAGQETFLAEESVGLVNVDGWWIPVDLHPDYGGNYDLLPLRASIAFGKSSDEWYEWSDVFLVVRREVEMSPTISVEDTLPSDTELEEGFQEDETNFEHYIGLNNLAISERPQDIDLAGLRHEFFLTSFWDYGGYEIAELRIATDADRRCWYVIDMNRDRVIGNFSSIETLENAVATEPDLRLVAEVGEQVLNEWDPGSESLASVLSLHSDEIEGT